MASSVHPSKRPAKNLWQSLDLPPESLSRLHLTENPDPAVNSSFKLGTVAQTVIGLSGLAAAHIHELRTGILQNVRVDARHAVLEFSERDDGAAIWSAVCTNIRAQKAKGII